MLCACGAFAGDASLRPAFTPAVEYPQALLKARQTGKVRVYLIIDPSGAVKEARTIESSHPEFKAAVQRAVVRWRFKPWDAQQTGQPRIDVSLLVLFGAQGGDAFSQNITVGLHNAQCAYLNHEVKASRRDYPEAPLRDVDLFWYTAEFLRSDYVAWKVPDEAERKSLQKLLQKSVMKVVGACQRSPERRFAEFLPGEVQRLLINTVPAEG